MKLVREPGALVAHAGFDERSQETGTATGIEAPAERRGDYIHPGPTATAPAFDSTPNERFEYVKVSDVSKWHQHGEAESESISNHNVTDEEWTFAVGQAVPIIQKMSCIKTTLSDAAREIFVGQQTSADTVFLFKEQRQSSNPKTIEVYSKSLKRWVPLESQITKRVVRSGNIGRYYAKPTALLLFPYALESEGIRLYSSDEMENVFPFTWAYLNANKALLEGREKGRFKDEHWYRFGRHQNLGSWEQEKLMIPYMVMRLSAYLDRSEDYYFVNVTTGGFGVTVDNNVCSAEYLCGLINSRALDFYLKHISTSFRGGYMGANKQFLTKLPIVVS